MKSDAEYKKLAYERTVLLAAAGLVQEHFLPPEGEETPLRSIECEELPRNESTVPEDPIIDVVLKLRRLAQNRELKMSRYSQTIAEQDDEQEWQEPAPAGAGKKGTGSGAGKGTSQGGGSPQPPAAASGGGPKSPHPKARPANKPSGGGS